MSVHPDTDSAAEGFAERWSRRKQDAGREGGEQPVPGGLQEAKTTAEPMPSLTDDDMPPVESLDEHSDYAAFLSPGVSEALRAQALRKLFQFPGLHLPDGLDDYDDDFTQFTGLGKTVTHEMQRMLKRELEADRRIQDTQEQSGQQTAMEPAPTSESAPSEDVQQVEMQTAERTDDDKTMERKS